MKIKILLCFPFQAYLNEFGYVPDNLVGSVVAAIQSGSQSESFTAAVLAFQQFAQIPPTGKSSCS